MDIIKEEEDADSMSSFNEGDPIGVKGDGLSVPAAFTVRNSESEVLHAYILSWCMI
jgi:hypothetical protein